LIKFHFALIILLALNSLYHFHDDSKACYPKVRTQRKWDKFSFGFPHSHTQGKKHPHSSQPESCNPIYRPQFVRPLGKPVKRLQILLTFCRKLVVITTQANEHRRACQPLLYIFADGSQNWQNKNAHEKKTLKMDSI
jgi:hypothetical protein